MFTLDYLFPKPSSLKASIFPISTQMTWAVQGTFKKTGKGKQSCKSAHETTKSHQPIPAAQFSRIKPN